jgi:hypothetical protein
MTKFDSQGLITDAALALLEPQLAAVQCHALQMDSEAFRKQIRRAFGLGPGYARYDDPNRRHGTEGQTRLTDGEALVATLQLCSYRLKPYNLHYVNYLRR